MNGANKVTNNLGSYSMTQSGLWPINIGQLGETVEYYFYG